MYAVLTIDQQGSRTSADLVPELVAQLRDVGPLRAFQRTAGDELQGVLTRPDAVVTTLATVLRDGGWWVGLGLGPVAEPLPRDSRAGRGAAFVHAREAVTRAKTSPHRLGVVGADPYRAEHLETVLWLWAGLLERRTARGWELYDVLGDGLTFGEAARRLGITQSAVSQRARAAGLADETRARALARDLLAEQLHPGDVKEEA